MFEDIAKSWKWTELMLHWNKMLLVRFVCHSLRLFTKKGQEVLPRTSTRRQYNNSYDSWQVCDARAGSWQAARRLIRHPIPQQPLILSISAVIIMVAAIIIAASLTKTTGSYLQALRAVVPAAVVAGGSLVVAEAQSVKAQHAAHTVAH